MEDEDGEVVKTYELPAKPKAAKSKDDAEAGPIRQGVSRVGTWTGLSSKPQESQAESSVAGASSATDKPTRQPLTRLGSLGQWGFGGKNTEVTPAENEDDDDDRRIRFTIEGAGRRLTKEDFLKEIQSLDPKTRYEVIQESDASAAMKTMARKDASADNSGSNRIFDAKSAQVASGRGAAQAVGAEMARRRGAKIDEDEGGDSDQDLSGYDEKHRSAKKKDAPATTMQLSKTDSPSTDESETAAERKRREKALRGIEDVTEAQRGRARAREGGEEPKKTTRRVAEGEETAAEKRRREAALGVSREGAQEDSDDDDTPRVPPPVARSRGIRFAQSPVRGKR